MPMPPVTVPQHTVLRVGSSEHRDHELTAAQTWLYFVTLHYVLSLFYSSTYALKKEMVEVQSVE
jgi:hypothetical protein